MRVIIKIAVIIGCIFSLIAIVNVFFDTDVYINHAQEKVESMNIYRKCIDGYEFVFVHNGFYKSGLSQILENTETGLRAKVCK